MKKVDLGGRERTEEWEGKDKPHTAYIGVKSSDTNNCTK